MLYRIIILAFLTSCTSFIDDNINEVDNEIYPYYQKFITEGKKRGIDYSAANIIIKFGDFDDKMGVSKPVKNGLHRIEISRYYWNLYKNQGVINEVTVLHEMGHSFLGRDHNDSCNSIMSTGNNCKYDNYKQNKKCMIDELFF